MDMSDFRLTPEDTLICQQCFKNIASVCLGPLQQFCKDSVKADLSTLRPCLTYDHGLDLKRAIKISDLEITHFDSAIEPHKELQHIVYCYLNLLVELPELAHIDPQGIDFTCKLQGLRDCATNALEAAQLYMDRPDSSLDAVGSLWVNCVGTHIYTSVSARFNLLATAEQQAAQVPLLNLCCSCCMPVWKAMSRLASRQIVRWC